MLLFISIVLNLSSWVAQQIQNNASFCKYLEESKKSSSCKSMIYFLIWNNESVQVNNIEKVLLVRIKKFDRLFDNTLQHCHIEFSFNFIDKVTSEKLLTRHTTFILVKSDFWMDPLWLTTSGVIKLCYLMTRSFATCKKEKRIIAKVQALCRRRTVLKFAVLLNGFWSYKSIIFKRLLNFKPIWRKVKCPYRSSIDNLDSHFCLMQVKIWFDF